MGEGLGHGDQVGSSPALASSSKHLYNAGKELLVCVEMQEKVGDAV